MSREIYNNNRKNRSRKRKRGSYKKESVRRVNIRKSDISRRTAGRKFGKPIFTRKMQKKIAIMFVAFILFLFALAIRLLYINNTKGEDYTVQALSQQNYSSRTIPYKRGDILDRNGKTLATSVKVYNLILDPKVMLSDERYLEPTLEALTACFSYPEEELRKLITENEEKSYIVYKQRLPYNDIEQFVNMMNDSEENPYIQGVWFETEYERKYPYESLACQVLGFTSAGNVGTWGIEEYYNDSLNGVDGREYGYVNSENIMEKVTKNPENGNTIVSTIDFNIQTIAEKYIAQCKEEYKPKNIGVIVMNPQNGEIYAMATDKNFDLNNPRDLSEYTEEQIAAMSNKEVVAILSQRWRNFCLNDTFEPGSTFKPFTVAAAMEENLISADDTFVCDGYEEVADKTIHCSKEEGHGTITLKEAVAYSCNDALMDIGSRLGVDLFISYQSRFNFGYKAGIDLPGEASCEGLLFTAENMRPIDLAVNSFGQNFNVNMIQLAAGFCSLINGGNYYQPHVVKEILNGRGGIIEEVGITPVKQTLTKQTSDLMKEAMLMTVTDGTGKSAKVEGYTIGGKTGTAQKLPREDKKFVYSYIGYAVYENPELICYVVVDEPEGEEGSSVICAKMFKNIMSETLPYLQIFPDEKTEGGDNNGGDGDNAGAGNTGGDGDNAGAGNTGGDGDNTGAGNTGGDGDNAGAGNTGGDGDNTGAGNNTGTGGEGTTGGEGEPDNSEEGRVVLPDGL